MPIATNKVSTFPTVQRRRFPRLFWPLAMIAFATVMCMVYRMAGPLAGAIAGLFWMVHPLINYRAKIGSIDPWLWSLFLLSMAAYVEGWHRKSVKWLTASLIFGML